MKLSRQTKNGMKKYQLGYKEARAQFKKEAKDIVEKALNDWDLQEETDERNAVCGVINKIMKDLDSLT
jgi:hypothetical protein